MNHRSILGFLVLIVALQTVSLAQKAAVPAVPEPVLVTISKETTRITEPLNANGYPDFREALNLAAKRKITTETNGAILVLKTVGLRQKYPELNDAQKQELYLRLGIDPLPAEDKYLINSDDYIDALPESDLPEPNDKERQIENSFEREHEIRLRVNHEFGRCCERPWKAADFPRVAKWLKAQDPVLARLDRLRDYPRAYLPIVVGTHTGNLFGAEQPLAHEIRKVVSELNIRAMHALGNGDNAAAIADFERMLILHKYVQQNSHNMVGDLIAIGIHNMMHPLFNQLLMLESLRSEQTEQLAELLKKHSHAPRSMLETIDRYERLYMLDIICQAAEFGIDGKPDKPQLLSKRQQFDYDLMLNQLNGCYDRLLAAARIENRVARLQAIEKLNDEVDETKKKSENKANELLAVLTKAGRSKLFADRLQGLMLPAIDAALDAEHKDGTRRELWLLAIALRKYHVKHGKYPAQLNQLVPQFIAAVPNDQLTNEPFTYRSNGNGMLLYSVGRDRVDHQGYDGDLPDDWADDIAIFTEDHRPQAPIPAKTPKE